MTSFPQELRQCVPSNYVLERKLHHNCHIEIVISHCELRQYGYLNATFEKKLPYSFDIHIAFSPHEATEAICSFKLPFVPKLTQQVLQANDLLLS